MPAPFSRLCVGASCPNIAAAHRDIIAIRMGRGQARTPQLVVYLVNRPKQAGFADADIMVTDYDSAGEPAQGLIVRLAATEPDGRRTYMPTASTNAFRSRPSTAGSITGIGC